MPVAPEEEIIASIVSVIEAAQAHLVHDVYVSATPLMRSNIVSLLFGKVYLAAPLAERGLLIKQLMRPLGLWSLATIADGVFAAIRFQGNFNNPLPRMEDIQTIQEEDVVALVRHVQQLSTHALNGMGHILTSSPALAGSAAALALTRILMERERISRDDDSRVHSVPYFPERRSNHDRNGVC